jgi:predicted ATPase/serine/threonine protein kinase
LTQFAKLGKYHVLERLAASRLAEIYKVKTVGIAGFEKVQILSRILPRYATDASFFKAFIAEAKIAFSLNHRNIVQVFEFGNLDGELFLATEYIPGVNLKEILREAQNTGRPLPVALVCYLMSEVAAGLDYAHRKVDQQGTPLQLVHGELAPYHVACSWEGSVKVLDFGLARAASAAAEAEHRYRGLPRYLAPEQVRQEPATPSTDIFSFGVLLWELLAGRPLMEGSTHEDVRQAVLSQPIVSPREFNLEIPVELEALALGCLHREPALRVASASELQLSLHGIQRKQGAIIGSRALSNFVRELFPGASENRDVRQDHSREDEADTSRRDASKEKEDDRRQRDLENLVDAAAEIAEPKNPPAERVPRRRSRRKYRARPEEHLDEDLSYAGEAPSGLSRPSVAPPEDHELLDPTQRSSSARFEVAPKSPSLTRELAARAMTGEVPARYRQPGELASGNLDESTQTDDPRGGRARSGPSPRGGRDEGAVQEFSTVKRNTSASQGVASAAARQRLPDKAQARPGPDPDQTTERTQKPAAAQDDPDQITERSTLSGSTAQPLGERKRCIAVAALLEGTPEQLAEMEKLVSDIAYKLDGLVHERGERLVVLFGLPLADENDVVSAIRFALDALEAVAQFDRDIDEQPSISLRIGIRSSTARIVPDGEAAGYHILGNSVRETINLAEHANSGDALIAGGAARRAAMHFVLRETAAIRRHGKPVRCYRIQGPLDTKPRQGERIDALVGREMELRALRDAWSEAVLSHTQKSVLLLGDAGVGKSRLVDEFLLRHCGDARVLTAMAMPHRRETPNALILDLLRGCTGVSGTSSPRSRGRMLQKLETLIPASETHVLETFDSLLVPAPHPLGESEGERRREVIHALDWLLRGFGQERPLVVVLEDFHWSDASSLDAIVSLVERPPSDHGQALLLLMTARSEDEHGLEELLISSASHISLEELDEGDRQRLILECLGGDAPDDLLHEVERRAGGNPFYISELGQMARDLGAQALRDIPGSISGVVQSRIDRLPTQAKVVLQHAAVCGPTFREGILTQLLARNPARSLAELRNRGILVPGVNIAATVTAGVSEQFEREWAFRHIVVQESIYEALSPGDRRDLHAKLAEIMATRHARGSGDPPAEIARHYEAAGQREHACDCYLRAAQHALGQYANKEAEKLYARALSVSQGAAAETLYAIRSGAERVHGRLGWHDKQAEDIAALKSLLGESNGRRRTLEMDTKKEKLCARRRADLNAREALHLLRLGQFFRALESAERAEADAITADDPLLRGEALRLRAEAYQRLDDHGRAIEAVQKALEIFEDHGSAAHEVRARIALGRILLAQSRYDAAMEHYQPALAVIKRHNNRWQERVIRNNMAVVHLCRGDFAQALEDALFSLKLCVEFGDLAREGDNATLIGIIYLELGMIELARRYLDDALTIHRDTNSRWSEADAAVHHGLLLCRAGDHAEAISELVYAKTIAQEIGARYVEVSARNALALTLCERRQPTDASVAFEEASESARMARAIGLTVGEIPALSRAGRAQALLGELESARALSRRAVELLDAQRHIDGAEQEIYFTHYRILLQVGDSRADEFLERAHTSLQLKVAQLEDPEQRRSLTTRVQLNASIIEAYRALQA